MVRMVNSSADDTLRLSREEAGESRRRPQSGHIRCRPPAPKNPPDKRRMRPPPGRPGEKRAPPKPQAPTLHPKEDGKMASVAMVPRTWTGSLPTRTNNLPARVPPSRTCGYQLNDAKHHNYSTRAPRSSTRGPDSSYIDTTRESSRSEVSALVRPEAGTTLRRSPKSRLQEPHLQPNSNHCRPSNSNDNSTGTAEVPTPHMVTMNGGWPSPAPMREEWETYTLVKLFVARLPANVTTADLYTNFSLHGRIDHIRIHLSKDGTGAKGTSATVTFKPPPKTAFWRTQGLKFRYGGGRVKEIFVNLSDRTPKVFTITSPVRKDVKFPDEIELGAQSIDFGVLLWPSSMMVMRTRQSESGFKVKLVLNLRKRELSVCFPSYLESVHRRALREYRFKISFDQAFSILQVQDGAFVLNLAKPPPYYKKLNEEVLTTHDPEATLWTEKDSWLRQTIIVNHKDDFMRLAHLPVALKNSVYSINIGRWTTFRISFDQATLLEDRLRIFIDALRDFNIVIKRAESFKFVQPTPPIWNVLDQHSNSKSAVKKDYHHQDLSLLEELNRIYLPFALRYQLEVCISNGWLNEYNLDEAFLRELSMRDGRDALHRLERVADLRKRFFEPQEIFNMHVPMLRQWHRRIPEYCITVYSATVTATSIIFHSPRVEMTNRVMRQFREYADRFLRIRFEDDEYQGNTKIYATTTTEMNELFRRVRRTLMQGITLGDRHYEFLAYGNSQLREHGAYFFAKVPGGLSASQIRAWMGQFDHEKIVAKHAARIGQCFSTTRDIKGVRVPRVRREDLIDDIERNGHKFTDGVGKVSELLARMASQQLKLSGRTPSVFQFRLGGCKGVLAVATDLHGLSLKIRKSQFKFPSESSNLEIIRWSETWQAKLNRQIIIVMSALRVKDKVFLDMQDQQIKLLAKAMEDDDAAHEALTHQIDPNRMTLLVDEMVSAGFRAVKEPFVTSLLHLWRSWSTKYMKEKAQLPVEKSACILGCIDETGKLQGYFNDLNGSVLSPSDDHIERQAQYQQALPNLPQVFVQVWVQDTSDTGHYQIIQGVCVIARNPSLHKGDLRVVLAVDISELHHLRDVLVLPQTGDRDLSSMCSGGDLDGDDYVVIWDEKLLPEVWNVEPMDYTPPTPFEVEGDVTQNDIVKFYYQYMKNDFLGKIAHAHLAWADHIEYDSLNSEQCLELVGLHSKAVDYPKTGVPAHLPKRLEQHPWPHFMEKKSDNKYKSASILGQLYDAVDLVAFKPNYEAPFDERILHACNPIEETMRIMLDMKHDYDSSLRRIMAQHQIKTEFEVWSTFCLAHSKASSDFKFHEQAGELSRTLRDRYLQAIIEQAGGRETQNIKPFAVAAYRLVQMEVDVALEEIRVGERSKTDMPFISFPWVMQKTLCDLARGRNIFHHTNGVHVDITHNTASPVSDDLLGEVYDDPAPLEDHERVPQFEQNTSGTGYGLSPNDADGRAPNENTKMSRNTPEETTELAKRPVPQTVSKMQQALMDNTNTYIDQMVAAQTSAPLSLLGNPQYSEDGHYMSSGHRGSAQSGSTTNSHGQWFPTVSPQPWQAGDSREPRRDTQDKKLGHLASSHSQEELSGSDASVSPTSEDNGLEMFDDPASDGD